MVELCFYHKAQFSFSATSECMSIALFLPLQRSLHPICQHLGPVSSNQPGRGRACTPKCICTAQAPIAPRFEPDHTWHTLPPERASRLGQLAVGGRRARRPHTALLAGGAALGVVALGAAVAPDPQPAPMGWGVAPSGGASGCWAWLSDGPAG